MSRFGLVWLKDQHHVGDTVFIFRVGEGQLDAPVLLSSVCFNVWAKRCRLYQTFYPKLRDVLCPLSRPQSNYNELKSRDVFRDFGQFTQNLVGRFCSLILQFYTADHYC